MPAWAQFATAGLLAMSSMAAGAGAQQPAIDVSHAWARATVPAQKTSGAYFEIRSRDAARLVGVVTAHARAAEIHRTVHEGGVVKMVPVKEIELPAGRVVRLAPGGYHVMLLELRNQLKAGDSVPLVLSVQRKDGRVHEIEVRAEVREPSSVTTKPAHHH